MKYHLFVVFFIFIGACNPKQANKIDANQINFKTRSDTELFFKNVRQIYYQFENQTLTKLHLYRFKTSIQLTSKPRLNLVIVHNWRFNEAYLLLEPNVFLQKINPLEIHWKNQVNQSQGKHLFKAGNKSSHLAFALQIYESILADNQLFIRQGKENIPLFSTPQDREAFRITVVDYLRLVGKI